MAVKRQFGKNRGRSRRANASILPIRALFLLRLRPQRRQCPSHQQFVHLRDAGDLQRSSGECTSRIISSNRNHVQVPDRPHRLRLSPTPRGWLLLPAPRRRDPDRSASSAPAAASPGSVANLNRRHAELRLRRPVQRRCQKARSRIVAPSPRHCARRWWHLVAQAQIGGTANVA